MTATTFPSEATLNALAAEGEARLANAERQERLFVDAMVVAFDTLGMNHPVTLFADRFSDVLVDLLHGAGESAHRDAEFQRGWDMAKGEL